MDKNKTQKPKEQTEQIKPLFEDFGNVHTHDEKSYNNLKYKK